MVDITASNQKIGSVIWAYHPRINVHYLSLQFGIQVIGLPSGFYADIYSGVSLRITHSRAKVYQESEYDNGFLTKPKSVDYLARPVSAILLFPTGVRVGYFFGG